MLVILKHTKPEWSIKHGYWMASVWKNNVSGTLYAVADSNYKQPLASGFYL